VLVAGLILAVVCVVGGIAFVVLDRNATINRGARVFDAIAPARKPHVSLASRCSGAGRTYAGCDARPALIWRA
jgi:hypothetical protein